MRYLSALKLVGVSGTEGDESPPRVGDRRGDHVPLQLLAPDGGPERYYVQRRNESLMTLRAGLVFCRIAQTRPDSYPKFVTNPYLQA